MGNTKLTPKAAIDTFTIAVTVYCDFSRLAGNEPVWGLFEARIGHKQNKDLFHGWYTRLTKKYQANKMIHVTETKC